MHARTRAGLVSVALLVCQWAGLQPLAATAQEAARPTPQPEFPFYRPPPEFAPESARPENAEEREENPFEDAIETDRDSFTPSTRTTGRGRLIVESSYSFIDNRSRAETHSFPELLLRYGLTERIEARLGYNYEVGGGGNSVSGVTGTDELVGGGIEREQRVLYGAKFQLTEQRGWLPTSSAIVQGFTPVAGRPMDSQFLADYVFGWELPNRWKADASIRYGTASEEHDRFGVIAPSAVLRVPLGERWNAHAEYFGLFSRDKESDFVQHYVSPGLHYLVTPNLEVGVRLGWGLNDQSARFFSNVGFGCRF